MGLCLCGYSTFYVSYYMICIKQYTNEDFSMVAFWGRCIPGSYIHHGQLLAHCCANTDGHLDRYIN